MYIVTISDFEDIRSDPTPVSSFYRRDMAISFAESLHRASNLPHYISVIDDRYSNSIKREVASFWISQYGIEKQIIEILNNNGYFPD